MTVKDFAARDEHWGARYLVTLAWQDGVDRAILVARQNELVDAIEAAGVPAEELLGDPVALAKTDAVELGSADVAATAAEELGMRDVFASLGVVSLLAGAVAGVLLLVDGSGPVDIRAGVIALGAGIAVCAVLATGAAAFFTAGQIRSTVWMGASAVAAVILGAVAAAVVGERVLVAGVPRWAAALAWLLPGLIAFCLWRLVAARTPQTAWADDEWFERFRGTLRAKGVHWKVAADYERNLRAEVTTSAAEDFGAPGAMARRLVGDAPDSAGRNWWHMPAFYLALALAAALIAIDSEGSGRTWNTVLSVMCAIAALANGSRAWRERSRKVAG